MRIAVCVKWVPDPEFPLQATAGGLSLESSGLVHMVDPIDMVACEAAVRLKEQASGHVSFLTVAFPAADAGLRSALALGGDEAVRIEPPEGDFGSSIRAGHLLAAAITLSPVDLIICGARSSDSGSGAVPAVIAEALGLPLVTNVIAIGSGSAIQATRRIGGGRRQVVEIAGPAVLGVEPSLCEPRYPSVMARTRAAKAPINTLKAADLGIALPAPSLSLVKLQGPRPNTTRIIYPPQEAAARDRIRYILAGGPDQKRSSSRLDGPVSAQVDQLLAFLRESGAVATAG
jgi:electron transfer flavoprotein beta subunit